MGEDSDQTEIHGPVGLDEDLGHAAAALREPEAALGYIVGRRAKMPAGTTVTIEVTGGPERTWHVVVEDRARVVDRLEGPPTVSLRLPALLFLRLAGGRVDPAPLVGTEIEVGGDPELGVALATHLAYTI